MFDDVMSVCLILTDGKFLFKAKEEPLEKKWFDDKT